MKIYDWSFEKVKEAVENNCCYCDALRDLGIPTQGRNTDTLKKKIKEYGLDISHFTFVSKNKGLSQKKKAADYLINGSIIKPYKLKLKLLEEGIKENKCEICGITEWLGKPINCQLHHIDGDEKNNELSNLQMLCPNCHSQTENYCGSANKPTKEKEANHCLECGREIHNRSKLCTSCAAKHRTVVDWKQQIDNLKKYIESGKNNIEIGNIYNVSEATIRKYRKKFNL